MNNNTDKKYKLSTPEKVVIIIAIFGFIYSIFFISNALEEGKKERAKWDSWNYEHIQKGANEYELNHSSGTTSYKSNTSSKSKKSSSTSKKSTTKKKTTSKTVDPMDHDIETYYEDYKEEFIDEDDAWDDFEDNEEYWDDY